MTRGPPEVPPEPAFSHHNQHHGDDDDGHHHHPGVDDDGDDDHKSESDSDNDDSDVDGAYVVMRRTNTVGVLLKVELTIELVVLQLHALKVCSRFAR